ncbi:hypothetical protein BS47DRAFT_1386600 [Hydnum rufescens UP504]|uniref:Uncharacterized protein n=1 Tax=Hydnum rufescens UP504 TaxID=1448309 RepID=A0A9P6AB62_9AGAM|nr:hypothetical protein BS47DRAFT_1386600 [Hydnum rufescens UP504]
MVHAAYFASDDPLVGARVHTSLRHMLRKSLLSVLQPTLRSALADLRASILRTLRTILWKDDVRDTFRDAAHRDVTASLLMAGMNALSSVRLRMEFPAVGGTAQKLLRATFVALVQAVVRAAPLFAAHGDDAKWDETWNSIRDTIREAAERAMKDMEGRWGTLWEGMMEEWVAGWEVFRPKMRGTARRTIKEMTELVNTALVYSVIETLPDTPLHIGVVKNMVPRFRHVSDPTFELQPYILKLIREHARVVGRYGFGSPAKVEKDMREAMDRVWRVVAGLDGGGANAEDNPTADVSWPVGAGRRDLPILPGLDSNDLLCNIVERRSNIWVKVSERESKSLGKREAALKLFELPQAKFAISRKVLDGGSEQKFCSPYTARTWSVRYGNSVSGWKSRAGDKQTVPRA